MNNIQSNMNFKARIRLKDLKEVNSITIKPGASLGSSSLGSVSTGIVGTSASHTAGSAANTVGSAFSAKAVGVDSFGIVPSVIEAATPHATPATIESAKAHPSLMGSIFSTIGDFFHSLGKVKTRTKDPS